MRLLSHAWASPTDPPLPLNALLWATVCIAFFGFLRLGEVMVAGPEATPPILISGIAIDSHSDPGIIRLSLGRMKTEPFGTGTTVFLGKTGVAGLCPVRAILNYLRVCPSLNQGPLLIFPDWSPLTRDVFVKHLKDTLAARGIDQRWYSGHSFRIGAATSTAQAGVPDHLIKALGRWKSEAYQIYIRTPLSSLTAVSASLARSASSPSGPSSHSSQ
ncbi:PREDICTED: uncharacterized protein LOC105312864 [Amphimedon queenslandica]|uniref:Tyr recombinase domain-containing protein n=1 Tax=Amphimedon queenslandica TaxID=400682 RepID=A0A1X7USS4_AMPQE|nr:PREDICTED: uncharacterized protein LOC105312864 [Amphimedon queenslandica]|eukprot:XP_011404126.1 PREDICTED: uncharacterized protein LOC105312864 [Amphimedon queenslandica]